MDRRAQHPKDDKQFLDHVQHQEVARLLTVFYPGVFPNLAAYSKPRADMVAIFLTGIPAGIIPGFQKTFSDYRRSHIPEWCPEARFDHYYRLATNTRVASSEAGKVLRVGEALIV